MDNMGNKHSSSHGHSHGGQGDSHDDHGHSHGNHGHSHEGHGHSHDGHGHSHGGGAGKWETDWEAWDKDPRLKASAILTADTIFRACNFEGNIDNMLDFGCGTGHLLREMIGKRGVGSGVGVDVEENMIKIFLRNIEKEGLKDKITGSLLKKEDGSEVPAKGSFQLVTSSYVFGHIRKPVIPTVIANLSKAVRPGGYLVISELEAVAEHHEGHSEHDKFVSEGGKAHTSISVEELKTMMESNGLTVTEDQIILFTQPIFDDATRCMTVIGQKRF